MATTPSQPSLFQPASPVTPVTPPAAPLPAGRPATPPTLGATLTAPAPRAPEVIPPERMLTRGPSGVEVIQPYVVVSKTAKETRAVPKRPYLALALASETGEVITGKIWEDRMAEWADVLPGDPLMIKGKTQDGWAPDDAARRPDNELVIIAFDRLPTPHPVQGALNAKVPHPIDELLADFDALQASIRHRGLRRLLERFYPDGSAATRLRRVLNDLRRLPEASAVPARVVELDGRALATAAKAVLDRLAGLEGSTAFTTARTQLAEAITQFDGSWLAFPREALRQVPAAVGHHHAYEGGYLEHTVEAAFDVAASYDLALLQGRTIPEAPDMSERDLAVAAMLMHDAGKVREYTAGARPIGMHEDALLFNHMTSGPVMLRAVFTRHRAELEALGITPAILLRLTHVQESHHGRREWGAVLEPQTSEAMVAHRADMKSAHLTKVHTFIEHGEENPYGVIQSTERRSAFWAGIRAEPAPMDDTATVPEAALVPSSAFTALLDDTLAQLAAAEDVPVATIRQRPVAARLAQFTGLAMSVRHPGYRRLLLAMFREVVPLREFALLPARPGHGRAEGGLLAHVLDVAEDVSRTYTLRNFRNRNRDLAVTAALLHEVGADPTRAWPEVSATHPTLAPLMSWQGSGVALLTQAVRVAQTLELAPGEAPPADILRQAGFTDLHLKHLMHCLVAHRAGGDSHEAVVAPATFAAQALANSVDKVAELGRWLVQAQARLQAIAPTPITPASANSPSTSVAPATANAPRATGRSRKRATAARVRAATDEALATAAAAVAATPTPAPVALPAPEATPRRSRRRTGG